MKQFYDNKEVKSIRVWAIFDKNNVFAGRVIWIFKSTQVHCYINIFRDEHKRKFSEGNYTPIFNKVGIAGGYGYDKITASFQDCLGKNKLKNNIDDSGAEEYFKSKGFQVIEVL